MSQGLKSLDDLDDVLIVQKIERKDPVTLDDESTRATQCLCFESGCDCERNVLVEEQEAIIKKQLQILQADERGKQALTSEIAALKEKEENRTKFLRYRQCALDAEKERARKIASLPPPLPKSIKLLLKKKDDEPQLNEPDVQMPNELTAVSIKPIENCSKNIENKENVLDPDQQKMYEEWDMKAKKRFNEALKKDRQREEYSKIMKQLQTAELLTRQDMAKNISSDKKSVPCPLSDKFHTTRKKIDMEDAAEKIFKKTGTKEHVIEDIEGYQDHYEEKYKKIYSAYETKMIDCVPSFVKENYDYLLEDESKFVGGKNFSGLDDSNSDVLNQAYIETPPGADELHETGEIHNVISHLDRLRSDLEMEYEKNVKPLLVAAIEVPKKESKDQAVETESVKVPAEDKAVETDAQYKNELTSPSPTATFNFFNAGVMAYKRRPRLPVLSTFLEGNLPDMHQRDVHYVVPLVSGSKTPTESWSPSTYCSLPSKHGIPTVPNEPNSALCDICIAEMKGNHIENNFVQELTPKSEAFNKEKYINLVPPRKIPLSEYVQQLAKKHLETKSTGNYPQSESSVKLSSNSGSPTYTNTKILSPAFEKEVIGKSKVGIFSELDKSEVAANKKYVTQSEVEAIPRPGKNELFKDEKKFQSFPLVIEKLDPVIKVEVDAKRNEEAEEVIKNEIYSKIEGTDQHQSPNEYSEYDYEAKRIQAIHQVLSRKFFHSVAFDDDNSEEKSSGNGTKQLTFPAQNNMVIKPHIYHELSTIPEIDSGLTASSLQLSQSKLSDISGTKGGKAPSKEKLKDSVQVPEKLKIVSLLDPPDTEIAELAKSIHFVPENEKELNNSVETFSTIITDSSGNKTTSSKEYLSTPTLATGSFSSVSSYTSSLPLSKSIESVPCVELTENKGIQSHIGSGYISDVQTQDKSQHNQNKKDTMNAIISGYISDLEVPLVYNPEQEVSEKPHIISGYNKDLEIPHISTSDEHHPYQDRKDTVHSVISGSISDLNVGQIANFDIQQEHERHNVHPMISRYISDLKMPEMIQTDTSHIYQENKINKPKSGYIRNYNTPHKNDSLKFFPLTPHSAVSSPNTYNDTIYSALNFNDLKRVSDRNFLLKQGHISSSEKNFRPMTPHSNISSPSESNYAFIKDLENSGTGSFKPMIPLSAVSSLTEFIDPNLKKDSKDNNVEYLKPVTPCYNASSPIKLAVHNIEKYQQVDAATENLKSILPYSGGSSCSKLPIFDLIKDIQNENSTGSFKALTPHSNVSSPPTSIIFSLNGEHKGYVSTSGSFKALTPHSNISSPASDAVLPCENMPIGDANSSEKIKDKLSFENSKMKPVILRFDISTDSLIVNNFENKQSEAKRVSQLNCNLTLKTQLKSPNYNLKTQVPRAEIISRTTDNKKYGSKSRNKIQKKYKGLHLTTTKQYALACSSDFFVPSLNENSTSSSENISRDINKDLNKPKALFGYQRISSDDDQNNMEKMSDVKHSDPESITSDKEISNKNAQGEKCIMKLKEDNKMQVHLENLRSLNKQPSNLQGVSSSSSSTENLSVISRSKVVYQSTPIKNMSELLQEPGILEEPDLTLVTNEFSCRVDTTEIHKGPLISIPCAEPAYQDTNCVAGFSQSECRTPISQSPQFLGCTDTPSMLSFLQHEMSCKQVENDSVQSPVNNNQILSENNTPILKVKEVKRSLFRSGYKERTKRLWNNLEEVKKRNLVEEKKKEIQLNRKKAKEFAMKLTPKPRRK